MIERVLGNRYKIVSKIGDGGTAEVYKGLDTLLDRTVTIKILKEYFASDSDFIKHFRKEARAVASLSHPNIVNIYDIGQEENIHYLVMEYVEGSNLKEIINKKGGPLDFQETVNIAIQICDALEHAHNNGVIHRDIKPHNILITPKGTVKVTDFGIARAVNEATITYTGNMVGSVHYISPEQARGKVTNHKSDIYSAGVVLYEMVTGVVPFSGDSPISVALKQIQEELPSIEELNPHVPPQLQKIIETALNKDPEERYASFIEMKEDLTSVLSTLQSKRGLLTLNLLNKFRGKKRNFKKYFTGSKRKILIPLLILILLFTGYKGIKSFFIVEEVEVPDLIGKSLSEAEDIIKDAGLSLQVTGEKHDPEIEKDHVISQDPKPGQIIKKKRTIRIEISLGPEMLEVPVVVGEDLDTAKEIIINSKFKYDENIKEEYSSDVKAGVVIEQIPKEGEIRPEGTEIKLVVSKGARLKYTRMPNLIGLSFAEAETKLKEKNLNLGIVSYKESESYFQGQVIEQDVSANESILQGSTINLVVSKGPGPKERTERIKFKVTDDDKEHIIKIIVEDSKGTRQVYLQKHEPDKNVKVNVPYYGEGVIKVYQDDTVIMEKNVP